MIDSTTEFVEHLSKTIFADKKSDVMCAIEFQILLSYIKEVPSFQNSKSAVKFIEQRDNSIRQEEREIYQKKEDACILASNFQASALDIVSEKLKKVTTLWLQGEKLLKECLPTIDSYEAKIKELVEALRDAQDGFKSLTEDGITISCPKVDKVLTKYYSENIKDSAINNGHGD